MEQHTDDSATHQDITANPSTTTPSPLSTLILSRHTTRAFHPTKPIPSALLESCLSLAQQTASSTNFQPWRLHMVSGARLATLKASLRQAVTSGQPSTIPPVPEEFRPFRSELGHSLYGKDGYDVARGDKEGMTKARMRNYDFFDAPLVAIVAIPKSLTTPGHLGDVLSVGLYVQTLVLLMAEQGLGTALQVAPAGYPDVIREVVGGLDDQDIICSLDIGWEDESVKVNRVRAMRDEWKKHVTFVE